MGNAPPKPMHRLLEIGACQTQQPSPGEGTRNGKLMQNATTGFAAAFLGAALLVCSGCSLAPSPLVGAIYTSMQYPSWYHGVDNAGPGSKRGTAKASSILGLVATGDASIEAAARNGRITKIHTADTQATSVLGLYATYTTIVTGE
jgi:hypothetical protein